MTGAILSFWRQPLVSACEKTLPALNIVKAGYSLNKCPNFGVNNTKTRHIF